MPCIVRGTGEGKDWLPAGGSVGTGNPTWPSSYGKAAGDPKSELKGSCLPVSAPKCQAVQVCPLLRSVTVTRVDLRMRESICKHTISPKVTYFILFIQCKQICCVHTGQIFGAEAIFTALSTVRSLPWAQILSAPAKAWKNSLRKVEEEGTASFRSVIPRSHFG